jgi:hypothetical protein
MFTVIYVMQSESQMPGSLMDFIRSFGAMQGLFSDNSKVQLSKAVKDILRMYNIKDMQSEPHKQWQNPAKRCIQEIKSMTNIVMDRSGAPAYLWLLCMTYCGFILYHLACDSLGDVCPIQAAFGYTPDISIILLAYFYQPILYYDYEAPFPLTKEKPGRMVGFAENKGDALTFLIFTDNTGEFITRSVIQPAADIENPNLQLFPESGEISTSDL